MCSFVFVLAASFMLVRIYSVIHDCPYVHSLVCTCRSYLTKGQKTQKSRMMQSPHCRCTYVHLVKRFVKHMYIYFGVPMHIYFGVHMYMCLSGCTCFADFLCINIILVDLLLYTYLSSEFIMQNQKWLLTEITL